jgi:sodium transport system permease protein
MTAHTLIVARKEIVDHFRDRRSLISGALYTLMGPLVVMVVSFSGQAGGKPARLLSMMSVFALVSAFTGGMAVAMDSTAGERERRSLVPLLLTPITSRDVVVGKWLATCVFALGALAINIAGVTAVMALRAPAPLATHTAPLASWVLLGLAPLACFAAALELLASAACRTTKEANTWLTFVVFVPMLVGMFLVFYPVSGNGWLALPVVGQQLVVERALGGAPVPLPQGIILALVTSTATIPVLAGAARVLSRDDVLAG